MVPRVSLHWVLNSLERGECMDPAEYRVEIGPAQRIPTRSSSFTFRRDSSIRPAGGGPSGGSELKVCTRCSVLIVKMDDGSCNHMTCAVCGSEFCWLCMKEISDLHYLSPSG